MYSVSITGNYELITGFSSVHAAKQWATKNYQPSACGAVYILDENRSQLYAKYAYDKKWTKCEL